MLRLFVMLCNSIARFELTPSIPILARIDVNAANTADNIANTAHICSKSSPLIMINLLFIL